MPDDANDDKRDSRGGPRRRDDRDRREAIPDLDKKFNEVRRRCTLGSTTAVIKAIMKKFPAARLDERDFRRQLENGHLNSTYQKALCEFIGLDWKTQAGILRGPLDQFCEELDRLASGVCLVEDLSFTDNAKLPNDLAMLALAAPTEALPDRAGAVNLTFTLNCPAPSHGDGLCVKAGWIEFDLGTGYAPHVRDRRGFGGGLVVDNARFTVHDPDPKKPSWHVEAVSGDFIGMVANVASDFLLAAGLAPPHDIRLRFRVFVANIGVSFPLPEGKTEKAAKSKLKQRLAQLKAVVDDDGKAILASIAIRLKARPTSTTPGEPRS
ncbi:MAG: hypothetical protein AB7O57_10490 [Hyphomicrobiaceae bacterium]